MPRFFTGDALGAIKTVDYSQNGSKEWTSSTKVLFQGQEGKNKAIQKLALSAEDDSNTLLAAVRADGSTNVFTVNSELECEEQWQWKETRLRDGQKFVGAAYTSTGVYSCTSNGALRLTKLSREADGGLHSELAALPMRLAEWRLAPNQQTFAYAGDEVELSVWDTERAFSAGPQEAGSSKNNDSESKKRKRSEQLLSNEIWRAKNLPNDTLNLRQPVRNTAITYLQPSASTSQQHLLVGTQFGDVRRYDTRAARRPVENWKGVAKVGAVGVIEKGLSEHEIFVSDRGCNLFALDLRNGKVAYGYKGLAGAVTSIAPSPSFVASGADDRFLRLHSTFSLPSAVGEQQEQKGDVLDKLYMKVTPTAVVWDGKVSAAISESGEGSDEEADDDVWEEMEDVESDDGRTERKKSKKT
ncbi:hypothetical protein PHLCEN_2v3513 [Hermanssonia centrifuga]|uniref:Ribosome biogenesis protein NSA1 n=1 Tax=Hermanssonia centrifuga TaxID=98765 RepID=A0A2R6QF18_9APHY|nr:hypothetical protein PHLCEN_2v3513 [Hermanssonia centrifuga]